MSKDSSQVFARVEVHRQVWIDDDGTVRAACQVAMKAGPPIGKGKRTTRSGDNRGTTIVGGNQNGSFSSQVEYRRQSRRGDQREVGMDHRPGSVPSGCLIHARLGRSVQAFAIDFGDREKSSGPGPGSDSWISRDDRDESSGVGGGGSGSRRNRTTDPQPRHRVEPVLQAPLGNSKRLDRNSGENSLAHLLNPCIADDYIDRPG